MELENNINAFKESKEDLTKLHILTNAMVYVELLRNHAEKENKTVYPFAEKSLADNIKLEVERQMRERVTEEEKSLEDKKEIMEKLGI